MYWQMKPGPERQAAKVEYERSHPLAPSRPKRGVRVIEHDGQFFCVGPRGGWHPFSNTTEKRIAHRLAGLCCPAIPLCLRIVDDGEDLAAIGVFTGRQYPLMAMTSKLLKLTLRIAEADELRTFASLSDELQSESPSETGGAREPATARTIDSRLRQDRPASNQEAGD